MEKLIIGGFIVGGIMGIMAVTAAPIVVGCSLVVDSVCDTADLVKDIKK